MKSWGSSRKGRKRCAPKLNPSLLHPWYAKGSAPFPKASQRKNLKGETWSREEILSILGSLIISTACYAEQKTHRWSLLRTRHLPWTENGKPGGVAVNIMAKLFEKAKMPYKLEAAPLARVWLTQKPGIRPVYSRYSAQSNEADYAWISLIFITTSGLFVHPESKEQFVALVDAKS